jgi:thiol-disulfide isomerase/thioredoxin
MSNEATSPFTPEQRIQEIVAACRLAEAENRPFDLAAILSREPELAEGIRARLAEMETLAQRLMPPSAPKAPVDFGEYELIEEIARGGMGVVFRAREKSLNRIVALKMIRAGHLATPDEVRRFRLEAEEASRLDHPGIVPIYHVGEHGGHHYFTMKLIEHGVLADQERGPGADLRKIARQVSCVAHAVHHAHRHGILHRDIKPTNILIDEDGSPHVTDFGLVKHLEGPAGQTLTGAIVGTPAYMSPEQAAARKDLTTATDVYSVGAVLYFLVTGCPPFKAASSLDTLVKVMEEEPVPPRQMNPRVDRDLETICLTCLNKDPRRRYAGADALARDVERYLDGEPIRARPVSRTERAWKWIRRRPLAAALMVTFGTAVVLLAGAGWIFSARLQSAVRQAQDAQARAEEGEREADSKRQQVNDYLVYLNERLANLKVDQPLRLEFLREGLALTEQFRKGRAEDAEARRQTALLYRCVGDLAQERNDRTQAVEAYGRAQALLEELEAAFPAAAVYRNDLAMMYSKQAHFFETSGNLTEALATIKKAIEVQDRLAAEASATLGYRQRAAEFRLTLGAFLEEQKKPGEAEAAYRESLDLMEQIVADRASAPSNRQQLAHTASTLAWLLLESKPAEAEALLQRCLRELREARNAQPDNRGLTQALLGGYTDLAAFFKQRGRHAELAALANQLRSEFLGELEHAYNAARMLADAIRVVAAHPALSPPERDALSEEYSAAAVTMLDKAVKEGFTNRARIEVDPDLEPLRKRSDFNALMTELERQSPNLSAEQELTALWSLFDRSRQQHATKLEGARTQAERQRALAAKPDLLAYAEKYLLLGQQHRDSWAGIEALVRVLEICRADDAGQATASTRQKAAEMLGRDHVCKPEFGSYCLRLSRSSAPEAERLLQEAMKRHPQPDGRGLAGLALAVNLARAGNQARGSSPVRAEQMLREAEQELERLVKEYGSVQVGRSSLAQLARHELDEVRYLSVGSLARDITGEDLKGRPLKLKDFQDKVVVLDFWADWCGFCRQMYPQEQDLMHRFKNRPFALLGINCDDDRDAICQTVARKGLSWPSWWDSGPDGGRIQRDWHIGGYPSIWVLDHKHFIRFKDVRGKELDDAVEKLVKEAEDEQARGK